MEFPDVWPAVQRAQKSFLREQAVRLCRRGLQKLVLATQERRTAHRMLKSASCACVPKALADSTTACQRSRRRFAGRRRAGGSSKQRAGLALPPLVRLAALDLLMLRLTLACRHHTSRPHRASLLCHGRGRRACRAAGNHNSVCGLAAAWRPHAQVCVTGDYAERVAGSGCVRRRIRRRCCRCISAATRQQVHRAVANADWDYRRRLLGDLACLPLHGCVGCG